jgi:hypothetical protein
LQANNNNAMDAFWYGLQAIFEFVFELAKPIGRGANTFFIAFGFIGAIYWLWYDNQANKGGANYMSESGEKK